MVQEDKLSEVLSEFARTLATDFPIQAILDHLVERIVEVLPITAAGVTLISSGTPPQYVAASDPSALRFEQLQTQLGQGPCISAHQSGEAVSVPNLEYDQRFPEFGPAAVASGLGAVFTFPLRHGDNPLGALDLYRDVPGDLDPHDMGAAQTLADVAAAYLLNAQARELVRQNSDRFQHIALHDPLTGLPNRLLLQQRLEHAAQRARRSNTNAAILFVDLDRFKLVNDNHGHHVGDELLLAVGQRLARLVRPGDTLARVSGDEFVFLCEDLRSAADVEILARRIDEAFLEPFVLNSLDIAATASVGMAYAGPGEDISEDLLDAADVAMYQAKRKGGACHQIIDLRESLRTSCRNTLEEDLRAAFDEQKLDVAYQPLVRGADGIVTGVEALLRWTHPDRGPVPTTLMIDIAEQSGLINELGTWVLERSCRDRALWLADHPEEPLDLAVNVSVRQLARPGFPSVVADVLAETRMDPTALVLEITESVFIEASDSTGLVLRELHDLGVRIALDDFGTGYSSLSYLHRLPIQIVKIDQSFIGNIVSAPTNRAIVAAVTDLSHVLGLSVTAEGVETARQRDAVNTIGCDSSQGYFYARPMPAAAIDRHLRRAGTTSLRLPTSSDLVAAAQ